MKNSNTVPNSAGDKKGGPTKFARVIFENEISLKEIADHTNISYPVLVDLKNGNRDNYHERTIKDIVAYINTSYKLNLKPEDIEG